MGQKNAFTPIWDKEIVRDVLGTPEASISQLRGALITHSKNKGAEKELMR